MSSVASKILRGATWMIALRLAVRSLNVVNTIVLARLLAPADFGLVAMASVVVAFLELLAAFGFDWALIKDHSAGRPQYDTAWTLNVILGACKALGLTAAAVPMSILYGEPRLASVLLVLSAAPFVNGFSNIGIVAFRKEMTFDREFTFQLSKGIASFLITLALALIFRSYWALVIGIVASRAMGVGLSYRMHPYRPRFCMSVAGDLFGFSKWLLLNNIATFLYTRLPELVVGTLSGVRGLGLFSVANQFASLPTSELVAPLNKAVYPGYAKAAANRRHLRREFLNIFSMVVLVMAPASAGIAAISEFAVPIVLGEKWSTAVPLIQILAVYGAVNAVTSNCFYVHLVTGGAARFTYLLLASALCLIPLAFVLTREMGPIGAAIAYAFVSVLFFPFFFRQVTRELGLSTMDLVSRAWRPFVASGIMYWAVQVASSMVTVDSTTGDIAVLIGLVIMGAAVFIFVVLLLWQLSGRHQGAERFALMRMESIVRKIVERIIAAVTNRGVDGD